MPFQCSPPAGSVLAVEDVQSLSSVSSSWLSLSSGKSVSAPELCGCLLPVLSCQSLQGSTASVGFLHTGSSSGVTWISQGSEPRKKLHKRKGRGTGRCPEWEFLLEGKVRDQSSQIKTAEGFQGWCPWWGWAAVFGQFCLRWGGNSHTCEPLGVSTCAAPCCPQRGTNCVVGRVGQMKRFLKLCGAKNELNYSPDE